MPVDPFYIIGTERSGSNLLRVILDAHPGIVVPHPPHVLRYFSPLSKGYGDLKVRRHRERLVRDVLRLVGTHIHPWSWSLDPERLVDQARPPDLAGIFAALYDQVLEQEPAHRWGCKSTFAIHHVDALLRRDPGARFLWLVRDPRDVAASSCRSVFSPSHPYLAAELWRDQQQLGLSLEQALPSSTLLRIHYESLLAEPEPQIRRILAFLEEPWDPAVLRFHEGTAARRARALSRDWQNTASPILRGNTGRYRQHLTPRQTAMVEAVAWRPMIRLGYRPERAPFPEEGPLPLAPRLHIRLQAGIRRTGIEWRSLRTDANHWRRWRRAALVGALTARRRFRRA